MHRALVRLLLIVLPVVPILTEAELRAQTPRSVDFPALDFQVTETAGIRRTAFPVNALLPIPQGSLDAAVNARLLSNGREVPAQISAEGIWADGSVASLAVDFNASLGPGETQNFKVEYGPGVKAADLPKGLAVTGGAESIQSGNIRFSRSGSPLIESVKYRGEEIGSGPNSLVVTDGTGKRFDLSNADAIETEVLRSGPIFAAIRYSGNIVIAPDYMVAFTLTVEMPNSKTLVRLSAIVDDPAKRLRSIAIETPLAFSAMPLVWDFGTPRWTYGSLRTATDSVTLTATSRDWRVSTTSGGKEQLYETSPAGPADPVRWGHLQDGKEVVAFALDGPADATWRVKLDGNGQTAFGYTPASPVEQYGLAVMEHFVTAPVQIGAATSPAALLSPLRVSIPAARSADRR